MRVGVLIRSWLSALFGFMAVTTAFCVALIVAITGPPSWAELRGVGDNIGAAFSQVGALIDRQVDAYNRARERDVHTAEAEPERVDAPPVAPPRVMAEAPDIEPDLEAVAPPDSRSDGLAGGLNEGAPIARAPQAAPASPPRMEARPPVVRAPESRTPLAARPAPPRTLAPRSPAPTQRVEIAPPAAPVEERASMTEQLMQAVEALIPTLAISEEEPKPIQKDPVADPYLEEGDAPELEPVPPTHADARRQANRTSAWTPQPGDRFPVDERDLERWRGQ